MIVDAPRLTAIAVTEDGLPVWIAAADPRRWAAHKLWLSSESTRDPIKLMASINFSCVNPALSI